MLILVLRRAFKRNNNAKNCAFNYGSVLRAYADKSRELEKALKIARHIICSEFSYGVQKDESEPYFPYIYYFQIGSKQISFHSNMKYPKVPTFKGEWIKKVNYTFPFDLRKLKPLY